MWAVASSAIVLDQRKYNEDTWKEIGESSSVWLLLSTLVLFPFGAFVYLFKIRSQLETLHNTKVKESLLEELQKEQAYSRKPRQTKISRPEGHDTV
jgi:hypothetical protein